MEEGVFVENNGITTLMKSVAFFGGTVIHGDNLGSSKSSIS